MTLITLPPNHERGCDPICRMQWCKGQVGEREAAARIYDHTGWPALVAVNGGPSRWSALAIGSGRSSTASPGDCGWRFARSTVVAPRRSGVFAKSTRARHRLQTRPRGRVMRGIKGDLLARRRVNLKIFVIRETNDSGLGWREHPPLFPLSPYHSITR